MRVKAAVICILTSLVCICALGSYRGSDEAANITFPVLSDMTLDIDNPEFILQNPVENKEKFIIKYEFTDTATGEIFFSTNWLEGGKQYHYRLDDLKGSIDCKVHIYAKEADTYEDVSGVNIFLKIGVKSYEA